MRKLLFYFGIVIFLNSGSAAFTQDIFPPVISNVGVNPNPFSPNGDGSNETTTFSFIISEDAFVRITIDSTAYLDSVFFQIGYSEWIWDGGGLTDGMYRYVINAWDTAGNQADSVRGIVMIDLEGPRIFDIKAGPSPFSPNGDGIRDYFFLEFGIDGTHRDDLDSIFAPVDYLMSATIFVDSVLGPIITDITYKHSPPPFDYYIFVLPTRTFQEDMLISFNIYRDGIPVSVTIPKHEIRNFRVGEDLLDKVEAYTLPDIVDLEGGAIDDSVTVLIYAFTGNVTVKIYDEDGNIYKLVNFFSEYCGCTLPNGPGYETYLGPSDTIPNGRYTWEIIAEDEAYNIGRRSGTFIADSRVLTLTNCFAQPEIISPGDSNSFADFSEITYEISKPARVTMRIHTGPPFDSTTAVRTLLKGVRQDEGIHAVIFDGRGDDSLYLSPDTAFTYSFVITAFDSVDLRQDDCFGEITIDNLDPLAPILFQPPTPTKELTTNVGGQAEDSVTVSLFRNGFLVGKEMSNSSSGLFTFTGVTLIERVNNFYATAEDEAGNISPQSNTVTVFRDATLPYVVRTFPEDSGYVNTDPLPGIYAVVRDDETGVNLSLSHVTVRKEGTFVSGSDSSVVPETLFFYFATPLTVGDDGNYTLEVVTVDNVGNVDTTINSFIYDTQSPSVIVFNPAGGTSTGTSPGLISAVVTDEDTLTLALQRRGERINVNPLKEATGPKLQNIKKSQRFITGKYSRSEEIEIATGQGSGVDFLMSTLWLDGPNPGIDTISGSPSNDGSSTLYWDLIDTLSSNGWYRMVTDLYDLAGNHISDVDSFYYSAGLVPVPRVDSTYPAGGDTVTNPMPAVWAMLSNSDASLSSITLTDQTGDTLSGIKYSIGNSIVGDSVTPTSNGQYTITIFARSSLSTIVDTLTTQFELLMTPTVVKTYPGNGDTVRTTLNTVWALLAASDIGISSINLTDSQGNTVSGSSRNSGDTLFFDLDSPLSDTAQNGSYRITAVARGAGPTDTKVVNFTFSVTGSTLPQEVRIYPSMPFTQTKTYFTVDIPQGGAEKLSISVYNLAGEFIWRTDTTLMTTGSAQIQWEKNGKYMVNETGDEVQNGMFIYVVRGRASGEPFKNKKLLMVARRKE
jgi:hypothetical protein